MVLIMLKYIENKLLGLFAVIILLTILTEVIGRPMVASESYYHLIFEIRSLIFDIMSNFILTQAYNA